MAIKIAVVLCLFGLARGGNLGGGLGLAQSNLGYGTNLGLGLGHGYSSNFGLGSNLGYENGWSNYGYAGYGSGYAGSARPAMSSVSIRKISGPAVPYTTGFRGQGAYGLGSQGYDYNGLRGYGSVGNYGSLGFAGPATSTVSINKYSGPAVPYSTGFGGHGAPSLGSQGYLYGGHSGYGSAAGYGNPGLAGAAVTSVSIKKYFGPNVPYASGFVGRDALVGHGYSGYGYGGSGYGAGRYENKW